MLALNKAEVILSNIYAKIVSAPDTFFVGYPEFRDQVDLLKRQKSEMPSEVDEL
jgi:hypothetical protein